MRKLLLLLLLLIIPTLTRAQSTSVSATIVDSGGVPWVNGTYTFTSAAYPSIAIITGTLDANGAFTSITFPTNAITASVGSQWTARICPLVTSPCFSKVVVIPAGPTLSLTSSLIPPAITIDALKPPPLTAYADSEIINAVQGSRYLNVTDKTEHVCTALPCSSNWQSTLVNGGTGTFCNLNGMLILNPNCFTGSDIGAQINTAYASLPSTGGVIGIPCQASGAVYNFSTPAVMIIGSKFVRLQGLCPANQIGTGGLVLNYTPTTATAAITIDYQNSTGSATEHLAMSDFTLFNNNCVTAGGCGSLATGVSIGSTNGGCGKCVFERVNIKGFGTGVNNPANVSWGQTYRNDVFDFNTVGLNYANGENTKIEDSQFELNGTAITSATGEIAMNGGSLDSNTVVGFTCTGAVGVQASFFTDVHFENLGQSNTHFISGTCNVNIKGGSASNDNVGGSSDWLFSASGGLFTVDHLQVNSTQTLTVGYFQCTSPARCDLTYAVGTPTAANPLVGGTAAANAYVKAVYVSTSNTPSLIQQGDTINKCLYGIGDASFTPSSSACLHVRFNSATFDALRLEDTGATPRVWAEGPGTGGNGIYGFRDVTDNKEVWRVLSGATPLFQVSQGIAPLTAGAQDIGSALLPFGNLWLGTAATNNFKFQPATTGQATTISMLDPKAATAAVSWQGGIPCTNGELALSAGWGTTATVTAVVGLGWSCEWTITSSGTGQAANPTITDTLVLPVLSSSIACEMRMVGGTGAATLIDQTTLSATAPIFTFGGTPVAASTYKVYRRC